MPRMLNKEIIETKNVYTHTAQASCMHHMPTVQHSQILRFVYGSSRPTTAIHLHVNVFTVLQFTRYAWCEFQLLINFTNNLTSNLNILFNFSHVLYSSQLELHHKY